MLSIQQTKSHRKLTQMYNLVVPLTCLKFAEYHREYLASYSPSLKGHLEVEGTTRDWSFVVLQ